jgi:hypothetical protein
MQDIEPYFNWRHLYCAEDDPKSPFFGRVYSEFFFTDTIYNHVIHPQWDNMGSNTLFIKILFADYHMGFAVIELMGEWNDTLYNDIRIFKRNVIDLLVDEGICKFILIGENVLDFHASDDSYYEEWYEDIEDGWIALLNFRKHVLQEFKFVNADYYFLTGGGLQDVAWRTKEPAALFRQVEELVLKRIG